jgi:putative DNA primase/helicase
MRAALKYAADFHWYVFPLVPRSKRPLIAEWPTKASIDPPTIRDWWLKWPGANIGIACGPSKLVVVDCDVKNEAANGLESWLDLKQEHKINDATVTQKTPSGGEHILYRSNGHGIHNSSGQLAPGVDIRADGGYIVAPPSRTSAGEYAWEVTYHPTSTKVLPLPLPLISLLAKQNISKKAEPVPNSILAGQRNDVLTSLAGTMRRRGMTEHEISAALLVVNEERCQPPLAAAEIQHIAMSVCRYEPAVLGMERVFNLTDLGNAERLAAAHGQTLRYCHAWGKWLHWNGQRWEIDENDEVIRRASETVRSIQKEAALAVSADIQGKILKWAKGSESRSRLHSLIQLAQAESILGVGPDMLDSNPWLLNAQNGIIDLRTGTLAEANPAHLITKLVPAQYAPDAQCPKWLEFLDRIMDGNEGMIAYLQRAVGYALTGSTREQCLFILYGTGANGKSVFLETLSSMLNDYAMRTPTDTLLVKRTGGIPNDVARLKGARLVTAVEADAGNKMAESLVKQITGGEKITARFLHQEWFEFQPQFKVFLATNHKPVITGTDHAIWRRIQLIPFAVTIPEEEQDKDLALKLQAELSGILTWAVQGCIEWQRQALNPAAEVIGATNNYRSEMDAVAGFLDDCCILEAGAYVTLASLYKAYSAWCDASREKALTKRQLGSRMTERGYRKRRGTGGVWQWRGLGLRDETTQGELFSDVDIPN